MDIELGKVMELEDGSSYLVSHHFMHEDKEYVAMVATTEPVHVRYAEVSEAEGKQYVSMVEDDKLIDLFKQYVVNDFFSILSEDEDEDFDDEDFDDDDDEDFDDEDDEDEDEE